MCRGDGDHQGEGSGAPAVLLGGPGTDHGRHQGLGVLPVEGAHQEAQGEILSEEVHAGAEYEEEGVENQELWEC